MVLSSIVHMKQADSAVSLTGSPGPSHSCSHSKIGAAKPSTVFQVFATSLRLRRSTL